jgi:hypothetical protein
MLTRRRQLWVATFIAMLIIVQSMGTTDVGRNLENVSYRLVPFYYAITVDLRSEMHLDQAANISTILERFPSSQECSLRPTKAQHYIQLLCRG